MGSQVKKPRGVVIQQQTTCYQRYTLLLLGLGLGSLLVLVYYTDHIQHGVLPRLKAGVKRTVCSVMTLPCPEEEEEDGDGRRRISAATSQAERTNANQQRGSLGVSAEGQKTRGKIKRRMNYDAARSETEDNPVLRVRPRFPLFGINRGRGIGPIPTWRILQNMRGIKPGAYSEHKDSESRQRPSAKSGSNERTVTKADESNKHFYRDDDADSDERRDTDWKKKLGMLLDKAVGRSSKAYRGKLQSSDHTQGFHHPKEIHSGESTNPAKSSFKLHRANDTPRYRNDQKKITTEHFGEKRTPKPKRSREKMFDANKLFDGRPYKNKADSSDSSKDKNISQDKSSTAVEKTREQSADPSYDTKYRQRNRQRFFKKTSAKGKSLQGYVGGAPSWKAMGGAQSTRINSVGKKSPESGSRENKDTGNNRAEHYSDQEVSDAGGQSVGQNDGEIRQEPTSLGSDWTGKSLTAFMTDRTPYSIQRDYDYLQQHLLSGGLNLTMMSTHEWPEEMRFDTKSFHLDPPLETIKISGTPCLLEMTEFSIWMTLGGTSACLDSTKRELAKFFNTRTGQAATHVTSHVVLLEPSASYTVGEILKVRVDVYNSNGDALRRGGDEVRVWLVERAKGASLAGIVTDLNNGSYLAQIKLQWTGVQQIQAELTFPREALRAHDYLRHVTKVMRYIAGGFSKGAVSEATLCSPFPVIPGYDDICNYTENTYGLAWFCGKPRKPELQCEDWVSIRDLEFLAPLPLTQAEKELLGSLRKPPHLRLIPAAASISIHVSSGRAQMPNQPCSRTHATDTWQLEEPRGFQLHGHWIRTDCATGRLDANVERTCLSNTTVTFAGDSTLLQFFTDLIPRTGCTLVESHTHNWHRPRACVKPDTGFQMSWALHGYPVHPVSDHWALKTDFREVTDLLDAIPADDKQAGSTWQTQQLQQQRTHRHVVLIALYIHLSIHHVNVFGERIRAARRAVESLLERSPSTLVLIRGPHTAYYGWPPHLGGDMMGPVMREMIVEEFRPFRDKVIYLDFWDMTVAMENSNFHPDPAINTAMLNAMLHHICAK